MITLAELTTRVREKILVQGHFLLASGFHGVHYVDKTRISEDLLTQVAYIMATFSDGEIQVIIAPERGAIALGKEVAQQLSTILGQEIPFFPAEKISEGFRLSPEASAFVAGKLVLAVEDITTTGGTLGAVVSLLREADAIIVGAAMLWNRGGITEETINVPWLFSVVNEQLPHFKPGLETCPGCRDNIPLNTELGHAQK